MSRQAIPSFAMSEIGRESLRRKGVVVTTLAYSVPNDPARLQPHYHDFFQLMLLQGRGEVCMTSATIGCGAARCCS